MTLPSKGDFVVASQGENKFQLVKVLGASADKIIGKIEASKVEGGKRVSIEVAPEDVVLNLGNEPKYGRVYGQLVEPLRSTLEYKEWGEIHFYRRMSKDEKKILKKALDKVYADLVKRKLTFVLPITIEIRHKQGRWAGHYKTHPNIDNQHNHLTCFKPKEFTLEGMVELARHEIAHAIYFQGVPSAMRLKWIKLYTHYLKLHTAKIETLLKLRKGLEKTKDLREFKSTLINSDDESGTAKKTFSKADFLDECISFIKSTFNLDNDEVELLIEREESLEAYWPKHPFDLSHEHNYESVMTEYGMTKPTEFFAEAFRLYLEGKSGKKIKKLMEKTLSRLAK